MTTSTPGSTVRRDAATVTAWNLVSRVTGLGRVLVLGGALGATRLGDTYQASNQLSNVVFEVLAAGTLSAVLVPGLVARLADDDTGRARDFAGLVLGRALALLVPLVVLGLAFAEPLMRLVFAGNDGASNEAQVRLGAFLLFFVLPQLVLYAWGALVTSMLHAARRFAAASIAPVANNVVVIVGLAWFWARGSSGVALGQFDKVLLGATALGGVVAMTLVPAVAAWRAGLAIRPRLGRRGEETGVGRDALWASLVVIPVQLIAFASIVVAGRTGGGVAAYQIAFTFFLLPHALVGHPTATVLYPRLSAAWVGRDTVTMRRVGGQGLEVIGAFLFLAAAVSTALAPWLVRVVAIGELAHADGAALTATALAWLALGLPAYAWALLLTRVAYAGADLKLPAAAGLTGAAAALVVLAFATRSVGATNTVALVALAHSVMVAVSALVLLVGNTSAGRLDVPLARLARYAVAAGCATAAARVAAAGMPDGGGRGSAAAIVFVGVGAGVSTYAVALFVAGQRSVPRLAVQ